MDDADLPPRPSAALDPLDCQTMLDVRAGVDEIDRMLVADRTSPGLRDAAARIKPSRSRCATKRGSIRFWPM
jgi:hypothetical protein